MSVIEVLDLTKDYGHDRGVFDISVNVEKGECYGFLGPNGAGKTTTIRHLMGFSKPDKGTTKIDGVDCWKNPSKIHANVGYLPGEIALPPAITGKKFLKMIGNMRGITDRSYCEMLLDRFQCDTDIETGRMSLGTKRKLAVVTAFMSDPDILILDEPTSGLDPVMQQVFIDFILSEKKRGKTIFLSSHIFHEVDATCDRIAIIRDGRIVSEFEADELKHQSDKIYRVTFNDKESLDQFTRLPYSFTSINHQKLRARVQLPHSELEGFIHNISQLNVADFHEIPLTLEDYFMQFYREDKTFAGVKA